MRYHRRRPRRLLHPASRLTGLCSPAGSQCRNAQVRLRTKAQRISNKSKCLSNPNQLAKEAPLGQFGPPNRGYFYRRVWVAPATSEGLIVGGVYAPPGPPAPEDEVSMYKTDYHVESSHTRPERTRLRVPVSAARSSLPPSSRWCSLVTR